MSFADFSDINMICCELCEEEGEKSRKDPGEITPFPIYSQRQVNKSSLFFENQHDYLSYDPGIKITY
ncbi:hypothetical protein [Aneurinibacillus tyrosinisolvens]|uniref:hypothetical protein n=1 Tax=Aneurinibacillus tyrosinisolvens TaxID=1443435 RepID=UPI00063FABF3|nr:hypothetical protein [Aneurinibacillus tyrosinisolvens]